MIAAEQVQGIRQGVLCAMAERIRRSAANRAFREQVREIAVPGNLSQAYHNADSLQQLNLIREVRRAIANLLRQWLVARGRAPHHRGDPGVAQFESVLTGNCSRLVRQCEAMQNWIHKVAGAITGEGPSRAIRSMRTGCQAQNQNSRTRIPEPRHRQRPVFFFGVCLASRSSDCFAVSPQPRATHTLDDSLLYPRKVRREYLQGFG